MEPDRVTAARGARWILDAVALFRRAALIWVVLNLVLIFIASALMFIPFAGPVLFALVTPVFMAGLIVGSRDVDGGGQLEIAHLFRGFQRNAAHLITVGGVYVVGQILIGAVVNALGGEELRNAMNTAMQSDAGNATPGVSSNRAAVALLVGGALFVPLAMAVWFAPALVILDAMPAIAAMKLSIRACVRNLLPMLIYGIGMAAVLFALFFVLRLVLTLIPQALGFLRTFATMLVFVIWVALAIISVYASYRDVFKREAGAIGQPA